MVAALIALAVGLLTGVVSGCGVGGGSLLMLYLTEVANVPTPQAAVVNLLYFLGCALPAIRAHSQNGLIAKKAVWYTLPTGVVAAVGGSFLALWLDGGWLRRLFGVFMLYVGVRELRYREKSEK